MWEVPISYEEKRPYHIKADHIHELTRYGVKSDAGLNVPIDKNIQCETHPSIFAES